jgi:hypothetical protein
MCRGYSPPMQALLAFAEFRGTRSEQRALEAALDRHCTCGYPRCAVHEMAISEQRVLDGLLFARRTLRPVLLAREFS